MLDENLRTDKQSPNQLAAVMNTVDSDFSNQIYSMAGLMSGNIQTDSGMTIRDILSRLAYINRMKCICSIQPHRAQK